MNTHATFETERAPRYLSALCHHFGRKVETQCSSEAGWVKFPFGRCDMTADAAQLALSVTAADQEKLDQTVRVMTSHLERFAFRENPELSWSTTDAVPQG